MSSRSANRFVPSLETLGERLNPGALAGAGALPDATRHEWVFGVELPSVGSETRVSTFPEVGRGSPGSDGVVILTSSLPGVAAAAHEQPRPTILLQRLANPGLPDAATREVRYRTFAIVDRTQLAEDVQGGDTGRIVLWAEVDEGGERIGPFYSFKAGRLSPVDVGANEVITIGANRTESRDPDDRDAVIAFFVDPEAVERLQSALFVAKQQALREDHPEVASSNVFAVWLTVGFTEIAPESGNSENLHRRNLVTVLSADLDRPGVQPAPHSFANDPPASGL